MRILLLFLCVLSVNIPMNSQEYIPMLQEGNVWGLDFLYGGNGSISSGDFYFEGEEIINDVTYKVSNEGCLFREEGGIVYHYVEYLNEEIVVLDFTLEVGDILFIPRTDFCFYNAGDSLGNVQVIDVDTEFIAGENRRVLTFEGGNFGGEELWIEGIGSTNGVVPGPGLIEFPRRLACFTKDGETTFFNGVSRCDNTTLSLEDTDKPIVSLAPNPVVGTSTIQLPFTINASSYRVYDITGKFLSDNPVIDNVISIHNADYTSGLYLYQIMSEDTLLYTDKFMVR